MKPVNIVGGGLSGLYLGIALRREAIPVTIWEANPYPRHRVCGEFISGKGVALLQGLGLASQMKDQGMKMASDTMFFVDGVVSPRTPLPFAAWCLSRWVLDGLLAKAFCGLGGEMRFEYCRDRNGLPDGWVRAAGRSRAARGKGRWIGVKFHVRSFPLQADLEMHIEDGAYVGLCPVEGEMTNVCALIPRRLAGGQLGKEPLRAIASIFAGSLGDRLLQCEWDERSFVSVAGLEYEEASPGDSQAPSIGDASGMIPPITGNGMSLALESAALAVAPVSQWARGEVSWAVTTEVLRQRLQAQFRGRLMRARLLQRVLVQPNGAALRRWITPRLPTFLPLAFSLTR